MPEQGISFFELLALQFYLGIPVFLAGVILMVWHLRNTTNQSLAYLAFSSICLAAVSVFVGIIIWEYWPFKNQDIMALEFVNLPSLIACLVSVPVCTWLFSLKQRKLA